MRMNTSGFHIGAALALATVLAGCAVGPQYRQPQAPAIVLASPQAAEWVANDAAPLPDAWWHVFGDAGLNQWIEAALAHNHDIRQAQASLRAARAVFDERRLDRLPGVTSSAGYTRGIQQQASNGGARTLSESWQAGFDVHWEIDLFGRLDRLQQAAQARTEASQAELEMVRLSIAAEVARTWFQAQGDRRQLQWVQREADSWRDTVQLAQARLRAGAGLPEDVENAQTNRLRSEAAIPGLTASLQQARHRLAVLAGQRPGQGGLPDPGAVQAMPLVARLPLGDVNQRILARPDVVRAERLLAASVEDVGAATAELYPRIDLGGFLGFFALRDGDFGSAASRAFQVAPAVSWPALRLGNARARLRGAEALSDGALARYEQVLLTAQEEVENAVTRLAEQQRQLAVLLQAGQHAQTAFDIADRRYRAGAGSYQAVLENQRALFQLRRQVALEDTVAQMQIVALCKALGLDVPSPPRTGAS
ncbi:MAG: efflux transporter outer membrane subunit [Castellaniella sp.]|uniref:efflux transporter outer membrane subunit n=1 Tax=Castellaniella sp. TaxID=1955812 RepID=UPI002A37138C|nr:efflux transporter outer membrane subunit [Castellaniella sp.]MDY0308409.1 efflux transporter outer membrane subunit [Castellaniella sp.]